MCKAGIDYREESWIAITWHVYEAISPVYGQV